MSVFLRLFKETLRDKSHMDVVSPASKPSDLTKMELPQPQSAIPARLQAKYVGRNGSGRESQTITAPQEATVRRSPQSAPL